jgi:hypothetical protein
MQYVGLVTLWFMVLRVSQVSNFIAVYFEEDLLMSTQLWITGL